MDRRGIFLKEVIPTFIANSLSGKPLIVRSGTQIIDFVFIDDAIAGLVGIMRCVAKLDERLTDTDINICSGAGCSLTGLANMIRTMTSSLSEIIEVPGLDYQTSKFIGDYSKAKEILGYTPTTPLEVGLKRYLDQVSGNVIEYHRKGSL